MKNKGKNVVVKYLNERVNDEALVDLLPDSELKLIIVVPCFKEKVEDLLKLSESLDRQSEKFNFEVIVVVNNPIDDNEAFLVNQTLLSQINKFVEFSFPIHFIDKTNLEDRKKAGVGLARKIGLDEGLRRFDGLSRDGILVCLDADCTVAENYLNEIITFFDSHENLDACSIGFKHRFDEIDDKVMLHAIIEYELHLRYYIQIQSWVGLPFAYQTVGSAMAIRSKAYAAQGGMPVLKAGEDFYFLHKFISNNKCENIEKHLVFPSGRISDRVPFGTGRAVGEIIEAEEGLHSYDPRSFEVLKADLDVILSKYPNYINICESVSKKSNPFYLKVNLEEKLKECVKHTSDRTAFIKRFFQWFDAFMLMKYVHFLRDHSHPNVSILEAVNQFLKIKGEDRFFEQADKALAYLQSLDYPNEEQV